MCCALLILTLTPVYSQTILLPVHNYPPSTPVFGQRILDVLFKYASGFPDLQLAISEGHLRTSLRKFMNGSGYRITEKLFAILCLFCSSTASRIPVETAAILMVLYPAAAALPTYWNIFSPVTLKMDTEKFPCSGR